MNDVKTDPYTLVEKLLLTFFSGNKIVNFKEFLAFFKRFDSYFPDKRVLNQFISEVHALATEGERIDVARIAMFIRDDVDMLPK